jgi:hypothetical protein
MYARVLTNPNQVLETAQRLRRRNADGGNKVDSKKGKPSMIANAQYQYALRSENLKITYLASGFQGLPYFTYQDGQQTLNFTGTEVRAAQTEIGTLVTVTLKLTVDAGSTSFSVLVPTITLGDAQSPETFKTVGVLTTHKTTPLVLPATGARETYDVYELDGSASPVEVPLGAGTVP